MRSSWVVVCSSLMFGCSVGGATTVPLPDAGPTRARETDAGPDLPRSNCGVIDPDHFGPCPDPDAGESDPVIDDPMPDGGPPEEPTPMASCPWSRGECSSHCETTPRSSDPCEEATWLPAGILSEDAVWTGRICLRGEVGIPHGVTLTVQPGTEVYAPRGGRLSVEGHLSAEGTTEEPILFSVQGIEPRTGHWQGIHIQLSEGGTATIHDATVEYGAYGVATWEYATEPTTARADTSVSIVRALLRRNRTAVVPDDNTEILHSTVTCNVTGIRVASEDEPIQQIRSNNLCFNQDWAIAAIQDGADANDNHWCTTDPVAIEAQILDDRDSLDMRGRILVDRFLDRPDPSAPPPAP